ncbi:xylan 1,4-beta-xylosidase [Paenibacillus phyllosphaerae]|uniref:Xylan 1,4-beta-xylosidase n=1 Tax=Paenibacillus phyllosphaerae TaxID=274593 RepID=A0A7W5B237_9BACL|nr:helix-turn-helix domain-containing protein [Paenibacillus phyllosphaerae]MBB3112426.1 xylan 1,4-beta-xylosidase [Paenibacillus phyllosphaerae]
MRYLYEFINHQDDLPMHLFVNSVAHVPYHWHKEVEIIYVLQGAVTLLVDQRQYELRQDDIIVINSMSIHKLERTQQDNVLLTLQFSPGLLEGETFIACNSTLQTAEDRGRYNQIRRYLAQLVWESTKTAPGFRSISQGLLHLLTGILLREFSAGKNEALQTDGKLHDYARLNRVLRFIDQQYRDKITLQSIADQEHLSLHYFAHFFSGKIGMPFQKYLTSVRLEKAVAEMADSAKSVTQIAHDCGFANVKLFNKYFKEKYGVTPSTFRESLKTEPVRTRERLPSLTKDSPSGDYYVIDTIQAMETLYRHLEEPGGDADATPPSGTGAVQESKIVHVHAARTCPEHYVQPWKRLISGGRAVEGLRADWQAQFADLQRRLRFSHIRFHGVFNDEMMVYNEAEDGEPIYNWSYVDQLYDFLLGCGIRPFVELSFMPTLLRRSNETIFWWKGNIAPPADQGKWDALVREFVRHCLNRYGIEEVKQWYFEVWNEPDLTGLCWAGTREEFFCFYKSTADTIKGVAPELRVGGPALGYGSIWNDSWAEDFMANCRQEEAPVDFFSFHVYSEYPSKKEEAEKLTTIMPPSYYTDTILRLREQIEAEGHPSMELFITEWNFSLYDRNFIHDTMFMAPFVIHHALRTRGLIDALGYWSFTDVFEESQVPPSPFYGGFGLLNRSGLKKPSYYALELLGKLGQRVLAEGEGYIVTGSADGSLQVLLYHYVHVDPLFASGDWSGLTETSRYTVFEEKGNKAFHVQLEGLRGNYRITQYRLNRDEGSVYDEWIRMGSPVTLTLEEEDYLRGRSGPTITTLWLRGAEQFEHTAILPPHGVVLLTLSKQY